MTSQLVSKSYLDHLARNKPFLVVVIYANWCRHCQAMKRRLGNKMQNYSNLIFCEENSVTRDLRDYFPHVRIYESGVERDGSLNDVYSLLHV